MPGFARADGNNVTVRRVRKRVIAAVVLGAAALAVIATIAFPGLRAAVAVGVLKIALRERGFIVRNADVHVASGDIDVARVEIDDAVGNRVFTADKVHATIDPGAWLGKSDRRFGLISLDAERPTLYLVKLADGSYNISPLLGSGAPATFPQAPMHADVVVRGGLVEFRNPSAPAAPGRSFAVRAVDVRGHIDQGVVSTAQARATYDSGDRKTPFTIAVVENDTERFARATLSSSALSIAPIVDGIVSIPAFVVEDGLLEHPRLQAYSIGYDPIAGPQWQLSGSADLVNGRFRVLPLTKPVRDVRGPLAFAGGHLATDGMRGTLQGAPVAVSPGPGGSSPSGAG